MKNKLAQPLERTRKTNQRLRLQIVDAIEFGQRLQRELFMLLSDEKYYEQRLLNWRQQQSKLAGKEDGMSSLETKKK